MQFHFLTMLKKDDSSNRERKQTGNGLHALNNYILYSAATAILSHTAEYNPRYILNTAIRPLPKPIYIPECLEKRVNCLAF